ncbi:hypothetical protein V8G54_035292 [Vigna mungo]|uniref:Uncharacterized protein n=1 Tax=Vigna mungo TaxID=3915 RepID=A0AAQ3RAL0_VIGMU
MNPDVLKNAKEGLKKVEKIETPQLTRTPAQRYKDLEARLDEMNRSGEGSGSDPQKSEAPVPSSEGQKPPSINAIKRGKSLDFRLGRSHHSCNFPVHRSREHPNRCRVPLFPVRESPSALTGRARILMSGAKPLQSRKTSFSSISHLLTLKTPPTRVLVVALRSVSWLRLRDFLHLFDYFIPDPNESSMYEGVSQAVRVLGRFPRVFDNLAVVWSPLFEAGVLGRWDFLFLNQFGCVSPVGLTFMSWLDQDGWKFQNVVCGFLTKESPPFSLCHFIQVPCCSPLPEAKDGVEPSFQDLQSDTFPLCYPAKPATSCAKVKRLFFLPRSLFFYICGRSTLYDRRRVTREEGTTSFSLAALLHFPFLIESRKPLHYWYRGQKVASSIC